MKPREIFKAQIEHRETETVPYTIDFDGDVDIELDEYYGNTAWRDSIRTFHKSAAVVNNRKRFPSDTPDLQKDVWGSTWRLDRRPEHLQEPGLRQPSFKGYRWPAPEEFFSDEKGIEAAKILCRQECEDHFIITRLGWGLLESSWGLRGYENAMMDMAAEPKFFEELLERLTEQILAYVAFTCDQLPEIDAIMFGDDWADQRGIMGGPERWRELFKPRYKRIYDLAHKRGKFVITHCCGSVIDIMPDVIEIGLDMFESVQPEARGMNPYGLKAEFGKDIAFWGCLGSQSTIPFGTPDEIRSEVRKLKREMGKGGGYILAPAKTLQPGTPVENAAAVVESFVIS
jgi:uroporphyrinogen decarboxylase